MINVDSTINESESLSAKEAAELLSVKRQTLYAYTSRGLLRRMGSGKHSRYSREDVERLRARHEARAGHGPVAAGALRFGEPVLDTSITEITAAGPRYRGSSALELAERGETFEAVCELLWNGAQATEARAAKPLPLASLARKVVLSAERPLDRLLIALPLFAAQQPGRYGASQDEECELARRLQTSLFGLFSSAAEAARPARPSELLLQALRLERPKEQEAVNAALVLLADHELNASSFAARVAASTGADLCACLTAAIATASGPRHGAAGERVEALLAEALTLSAPERVVDERARRGEVIPGIGQALYPDGDPRAALLLRRARELGRRSKACQAALAIARVVGARGQHPNVDFALVALTAALTLPPGTATLLFALGRSAGWIAHVLEQRGSDFVLRPRARYVASPVRV
jgi:citrate synthase